jgi:hypothetical protein
MLLWQNLLTINFYKHNNVAMFMLIKYYLATYAEEKIILYTPVFSDWLHFLVWMLII